MISHIITNCETLTKMNQESQNRKLRLFAKVDILTKLNILEQQKQLFHKLKSKYSDIDNAVLTLSSLILSIDLVTNEINNINLNAIKLRAKNYKFKVKREKLLSYWSIVRALKLEQNMSFRSISRYFLKYHKLEISHSTIFQIWNEIENNEFKGEISVK